jgi:hypothetical protein
VLNHADPAAEPKNAGRKPEKFAVLPSPSKFFEAETGDNTEINPH